MSNLNHETLADELTTTETNSITPDRYLSSLKRMIGTRRIAALACLSAAIGIASSDSSLNLKTPREGVMDSSHSLNWAGYTAPNPGAFNFIQERFLVVPTLDCPASGDYDATSWVGMGSGISTDVLYQTGIGMACNDGVTSYRTWWEDYPTEAEQSFSSSGTISSGDKIQEIVSITQNGVKFEVDDYGTSGTSMQWSATKQKTVLPVPHPSAAECITERPTVVGGGYEDLTDFGTLNVTSDKGCDLVAGAKNHIISSIVPGINGAGPIDMYNANDDPLALTSDPSSLGDYTVTWKAGS
ncbi:MAG TPA: G1 family glutamic endopeptidase [Candidatus Saccharimonadales bacterium]|nr:G1 family glutamic endopeptidase [Candidatus Saccharimonadales bacterium]